MSVPYVDPEIRVLVIDDDIDLLMLLERSLEKAGYLVQTAASVEEGEELYGLFRPHIILLDININGQDGRYLCGKIKMRGSEYPVKILLMTGFDYNFARCRLFGADDVLAKPFATDFLFIKLKELLLSVPRQPRPSTHWSVAPLKLPEVSIEVNEAMLLFA